MHVVVVLIHVGPPCFSFLHLWTCGEQSVGFGCGFVWGTSNQTRFLAWRGTVPMRMFVSLRAAILPFLWTWLDGLATGSFVPWI
jgi:hypothetical protein